MKLPFIVADIGGTHARFALVSNRCEDTGELTLAGHRRYYCRDFSNFDELLAKYLADSQDESVVAAVIAIAAPVVSDTIRLTNLSWVFSVEATRRRFGFESLHFINDFGAFAYATLYTPAADRVLIKSGTDVDGSRAVIGPGTGLGVAGLIRWGEQWITLSGEGGHVTFSPSSPLEMEIRRIVSPDDEHLSAERLLSGPGLTNLYKALSLIHDTPVESLTPEDISTLGLSGKNSVCVEVLKVFLEILGSFAGNVCLTYGAVGGVFLGGGILPKIWSDESAAIIANRFCQKGRMQALLSEVPIYLITADQIALHGAGHWLYDRRR